MLPPKTAYLSQEERRFVKGGLPVGNHGKAGDGQVQQGLRVMLS